MKTLNEFLNTNVKLKINFQKFTTKEEVCNFFDSNGFENFESADYNDYFDMISEFSNSKKPIYCTGKFDEDDSQWWVRFGKGGEDNYIFFWNVKGTMPHNYSVNDSHDNYTIKEFKTFKEFKDYVINYFDW